MLASDTIELGEDIALFTSCFELVSVLKNSPYYHNLIVLDKKNQAHYELQVPKTFKKLSILLILSLTIRSSTKQFILFQSPRISLQI